MQPLFILESMSIYMASVCKETDKIEQLINQTTHKLTN